MEFKNIVHEVAEILGLEVLEPDENGVCRFIAEEMEIIVQDMGKDDTIIMSTLVDEIPADRLGDASLFRALAEANYLFEATKGATVSCEPGTNRVWLIRADRAYDWSGNELVHMIGQFAEAVLGIRKLLAGESPVVAEKSVSVDEDEGKDIPRIQV